MLDSDLKISQWRQQRKKGLFHFIISHYFLEYLGVLEGKTQSTYHQKNHD